LSLTRWSRPTALFRDAFLSPSNGRRAASAEADASALPEIPFMVIPGLEALQHMIRSAKYLTEDGDIDEQLFYVVQVDERGAPAGCVPCRHAL
jgi:hypothetical protein